MTWREAGILYLLAMNLIGLAVMGIDKHRARVRAWRIPERTLFLVSIAGGSLGTWLGMYVFRHKTKHWYFVVWMPVIAAVHAGILVWLHIRYFR